MPLPKDDFLLAASVTCPAIGHRPRSISTPGTIRILGIRSRSNRATTPAYDTPVRDGSGANPKRENYEKTYRRCCFDCNDFDVWDGSGNTWPRSLRRLSVHQNRRGRAWPGLE